MKNNILKFIFIVSLLLNVSLVGTAAYTYYKQAGSPKAPFIGRGVLPGPPAAMSAMLFEELALTPEQKQVFRQKAAAFHADMNVKRKEVAGLRNSLMTLMRADQPDGKEIEAIIGQINSKQNNMQKMVVSHMLEFKSMLGKEQQKKFLDMIEGAMMNRHSETLCPQSYEKAGGK